MTYYTSLTGLQAANTQLAATSNNVANVDTNSFKRSKTSFEAIYSSTLQQSPTQTGQGVAVASIQQDFGQGNIANSANQLDLAVLGNGFFPVKSSLDMRDMFTRDGAFKFNQDRFVVNSAGEFLQVARVDAAGNPLSTTLQSLQIPQKTTGQFRPTRQLELSNNFSAESKVINKAFNSLDPSTYSYKNNMELVDGTGKVHQGTLFYIKAREADELNPTTDWKTVLMVDGQVVPVQPREYTRQAVPTKQANHEFIEWSGQGGGKDVIKLNASTQFDTSFNAVSLVGDRVYLGTGDTARQLGTLDPLNNGLNGKPLRINLTRQAFENSNFTDTDNTGALKGWTRLDGQVRLDGSTLIAGFPTPVDETRPAQSAGDAVVASNANFSSGFSAAAGPDGTGTARLNSTGNIDAGYGILRGPAIVSDKPVSLKSGDQVSFDWKASGGNDAYDVYAYLLNVDTGQTVKLLDQTGRTASDQTDWQTATQTVQAGGNYKFVFVSGSFDASGGQATGAQLFVDNIRTPATAPLNSSMLDPLVSYSQTLTDQSGLIRFDTSGNITPDLQQLQFQLQPGSPDLLSIRLKGSTQSPNAFALRAISQDGRPEGELTDIGIQKNGLVTGVYSNGHQAALGQILLANFTNTSELGQMGESRYITTVGSGAAFYGTPGDQGFGQVQSGALEKSNVNLTNEMVDLIAAQRNFQANAKAIETMSFMTKSLVDNIT